MTSARAGLNLPGRQDAHARAELVDADDGALLQLCCMGAQDANDIAAECVRKNVLSPDLDDAGTRRFGQGKQYREIEIVGENNVAGLTSSMIVASVALGPPVVSRVMWKSGTALFRCAATIA